jgi:FkbM family methyltransferase
MFGKNTMLRAMANVGIKALDLDHANTFNTGVAARILPTMRVSDRGREFTLACPTEIARYRAATFFTKEPATIKWIDGMNPGETFFDIGANIGIYSLYAASRGLRVYAIEPEAQNFALLNRNIALNHLDDLTTALNLAVSDREAIDHLCVTKVESGSSLHNLGEAVDYAGRAFVPAMRQGVLSVQLDSFLERFPDAFPTHLKIDVDGIEAKIIAGADKTLADRRLRSLLIELSETAAKDKDIGLTLKGKGFTLVDRTPSDPDIDPATATLRNCIFQR